MDTRYSKVIKAKGRTYFVDVKETKGSEPYLAITESRRSKEDANKYSKTTVMVFKEQTAEFVQALNEATGFIN